MGRRIVRALCVAAVAVSLFWVSHASLSASPQTAPLTIDYPSESSIFPPDIAPPTFLWRDESRATSWQIDISFPDSAAAISLRVPGTKFQLAEIDRSWPGATVPEMTREMQSQHTWKPDAKTWADIKKRSAEAFATMTIKSCGDNACTTPLSQASIHVETSKDPVVASLFYRDVPLIPVDTSRGVIAPLPKSAIPLIKWRVRSIAQSESKVVMENLPTCANCHSFSGDGKTLGLDVDGPANDKGLYALISVQQRSAIRNQDVIKWSSFSDEPAKKRFGFMSQVSPNGEYVITTIDTPGQKNRGLVDRFFNAAYKDFKYGQVFYPTRGVLAWYSRKTGKLQPLPGADDPEFVQASAFWSPDSKYLIFSKARGKDPWYAGQPAATYANDPNETQIQYDLYRIPFNEGRGGKAERIEGASENGFSNNFPKVSPDGKWIVFVRCKNGLLMRPDSKLYIVPFEGGTARPLESNLPSMNSWHSFSPNGRWLVFSSKGRWPYTQMFLTHLDENGHASPPILIEDATAPNRAVNIPEFANFSPDALDKIDTPATDYYAVFDAALDLVAKGDFDGAIPKWKQAIELNPEDGKARFNLALAFQQLGRVDEAIEQYQKELQINPDNAGAHANLAVALGNAGRLDEAIVHVKRALELAPEDAVGETNLAQFLLDRGDLAEAAAHAGKALELNPDAVNARVILGLAMVKAGDLNGGISEFEKALSKDPDSVDIHNQLGRALVKRGDLVTAVPHLERAGSDGSPTTLGLLAVVYARLNRFPDAARAARRALDGAEKQNRTDLVQVLRQNIEQYESMLHASP